MTIFKMIAYKIYESVIDITTADHAHFFIEIANAFFRADLPASKHLCPLTRKEKTPSSGGQIESPKMLKQLQKPKTYHRLVK